MGSKIIHTRPHVLIRVCSLEGSIREIWSGDGNLAGTKGRNHHNRIKNTGVLSARLSTNFKASSRTREYLNPTADDYGDSLTCISLASATRLERRNK